MVETYGLVDTHIHGFMGDDTSDGSSQGIVRMARNLAKSGICAFMPTTMTVSFDDIKRSFDAVAEAKEILSSSDIPCASILGIHLEGPFLNSKYAGVQSPEYLRNLDSAMSFIPELESEYPGLLKIISIAPELPGADDFIKKFSSSYSLSIAHSCCDYDCAKWAFSSGVNSVTHALNAMGGIDKRAPGIVGAAYDSSDVFVELICDGIHVQPPIVRMMCELFDSRLIVVSDAMRGANMPDGEYALGNEKVQVRGGRTYFGPSGGLAGSVTYMSQEVKRLVSFGVPLSSAIRYSTENPLRRIRSDFSLESCPMRLEFSESGELLVVKWNGSEI